MDYIVQALVILILLFVSSCNTNILHCVNFFYQKFGPACPRAKFSTIRQLVPYHFFFNFMVSRVTNSDIRLAGVKVGLETHISRTKFEEA